MANQIQVLKQTELCGRQFNVYGTVQDPLFFAQDVASMLQLTNVSDMVQRVDDDERSKFNLGRQGEGWFLTENGLYEVLMQSRKPIAKQFKKGVKAILKEIRINGGYVATAQDDTPELIMARALQVAQVTIERHQQQLEQANERISLQANQIQKLQPKADFADAAFKAEGNVDIGQAAKILGLPFGRNTLFRKLREKGVLFGSKDEPKQKFVDAGYFLLTELPPIKRENHPDLIVMKCICTQKGLAYINTLFGGRLNNPTLTTIK